MTDAVESRHKNDHIGEEKPILLHSFVRFFEESEHIGLFGASMAASRLTFLPLALLTFGFGNLEVVCLWQKSAPDDDQDGRASAEPEKTSPSLRGRRNESSIEDGSEEITYRISLLEQTRKDTAGVVGKIFQCSGSSRPQKPLEKSVWSIIRKSRLERTPIAIPYSARTPKSCERFCVKPEASSRTMKQTKLPIMIHLRPYLLWGQYCAKWMN